MTLPLDRYLAACEEAAFAAGEVLMEWANRFAATEKAPRDLVTEADVASQDTIRKVLSDAFPLHGFLAEENAAFPSQDDGLRWIVDPLDGTVNYVHRLPNYAVSIALEQHGVPLVGVVYDPVSVEFFSAIRGGGAFFNRNRIQVSDVQTLSRALVANSFASSVRRGDREVAEFEEVLFVAQATRRMGSSALNLAYLAAGRFDAYWARSTKIWDIAAGVLLVTEAGGVVTTLDGGPLDLANPRFIAAATPSLHKELRQTLERAAGGGAEPPG